MDEASEFLDGLLDREAQQVSLWIAQSPEYPAAREQVVDDCVASRGNAPAGFRFTAPELPTTFTALPLRTVSEAARGMAARFRRRTLLRRDDWELPSLGRLAGFALCHHEHPGRPGVRWTVGPTKAGVRVLRTELPCVRCFATGGPSGVGCGFEDEVSGARCSGGWLSQGGLDFPLLPAVAIARLERPADARWHRWFDA